MTPVRVLSVAPEIHPLIKTGGLADVAGALPKAVAAEGVEMRSLVPGYPAVMARLPTDATAYALEYLFGGPATILHGTAGGLDLYVLHAPHLYDRDGTPYQSPQGIDWADNAERFAGLSLAAREIGLGRIGGWRPDVVHAHDWQAGLTPAYLAFAGEKRPGTVLTLHNLAFQGQFPLSLMDALRIPAEARGPDGVEYYQSLGFLKAGVVYADRITTVSPAYAREVQTPEGGMGMDGVFRARGDDLVGIVNGIDEQVWDPRTDSALAARYTARRLGVRARNKAAVQERFALEPDGGAPLFCMVTRLTGQKGADLVLETLPRLLTLGGQLALLGSGDPGLEAAFASAASRHPGRVGCVIGYDEALSHLMQGGGDVVLVPSRFEPCGLTQLYGLRYGAVPLVARTGGLADTVIDANEAAIEDGVATGVQFAPTAAPALADALGRAVALYRQPKIWAAVQRRGMSRKLGWGHRAKDYAEVYRSLRRPAS